MARPENRPVRKRLIITIVEAINMDNKQRVISYQDVLKISEDSYIQGAIDAVETTKEVLLSDKGKAFVERNDFVTLIELVKSDMLKAVNNG